MAIQWYPGHMAKAKKEIEEKLKLVDIVLELIDSRIPMSSRNPMINDILKNKPRLILMTKCDMADATESHKWEKYFLNNGCTTLMIDSLSGFNVKKIVNYAKETLKDKLLKERERGLKERSIRCMIVGIPNVGKSTLINTLVKKKVTLVGNKPGVTKAQQWIKINKDLDLLDTPGVLWPKFDNEIVGLHLAITGAIKSEILSTDDIGEYLLQFLIKKYPELLSNRYNITDLSSLEKTLEGIATSRGIKINNDYERIYELVLNDFKNVRIGKITLDRVEDYE